MCWVGAVSGVGVGLLGFCLWEATPLAALLECQSEVLGTTGAVDSGVLEWLASVGLSPLMLLMVMTTMATAAAAPRVTRTGRSHCFL